MIHIVPISLHDARKYVAEHHAHHRRRVTGHLWSVGAAIDVPRADREVVGVVIVGRPVAPVLQAAGDTLEVTRLCCPGTMRDPRTRRVASRLLGAAAAGIFARGYRRAVSYTRDDEDGVCYRAAGWVPVAMVNGRDHTTGNRSQRWLPGMYEPSTETVDRVRWEVRPTEHVRAVVKMIAAMGRFARIAKYPPPLAHLEQA